jgi:hypothetical protein
MRSRFKFIPLLVCLFVCSCFCFCAVGEHLKQTQTTSVCGRKCVLRERGRKTKHIEREIEYKPKKQEKRQTVDKSDKLKEI